MLDRILQNTGLNLTKNKWCGDLFRHEEHMPVLPNVQIYVLVGI